MKKLLAVLFASMFATGVFAAAHMPGEADKKKGDAKKTEAKKDMKKEKDDKKADKKK